MEKSKLATMDKLIAELVNKSEHKTLEIWAADCAERVLPYFKEKYPEDNRPRKAIEAGRACAYTGVFMMADVRNTALAAHAAAREVEEDNAARSAARAAGQALGTAHVARHAIYAAIYATTAVRYATGSTENAAKERVWQYNHLIELRKKLG
jgi:hypothetical protein